jgi:trimeric autotransporter adhesin
MGSDGDVAAFEEQELLHFQFVLAVRVVWLMCVALGLASCKDSPTELGSTSVVLSSATLTFNALGTSQQLTATVRDQRGDPMPGAGVTWASGDAQVATVTTTGLVTAVGNGTTTVTASSGAASDSASVTVQQVAVSLTLSDSSLSLTSIGDTARLTAAVKDGEGADMPGASVTWASGDAQVATVTSAGLVTAVGNGITTVTATSGAASASASVTVQQVATHILKVHGDGQTGTIGEELLDTLMVSVLDAGDNPVAGIQIAWTPLTGGGEANPAGSTSGKDGLAATQWRLGPASGEQSLAASVSALPAISGVEFTAQGQPPIELGPRQFIAAGGSHTCALTDSGEAYCWGNNGAGMLGSAGPPRATTPTRVPTAIRFASNGVFA